MDYKDSDFDIKQILDDEFEPVNQGNCLVRLRHYIGIFLDTFDPKICLLPHALEKIITILDNFEVGQIKEIFFYGGFNLFFLESFKNPKFPELDHTFCHAILFLLDYFAKDDYVSEYLYENSFIDASMIYLEKIPKLDKCYDLLLSFISKLIPYAIHENTDCLSELPFDHLLLSKIGAMKLLIVVARYNHQDEYAFQILNKLMSSTNWQLESSHLAMWIVCYLANNCSVRIEEAIIAGINEKPPIFKTLANQVQRDPSQMAVPFLQTCILLFRSESTDVRGKICEMINPDFFISLFTNLEESKERILAFRAYTDSLNMFENKTLCLSQPDPIDFICDIILNESPRLKVLALRLLAKTLPSAYSSMLTHIRERGILRIIPDILSDTGTNVSDAKNAFVLIKATFDSIESAELKREYVEELSAIDFFESAEEAIDFLEGKLNEAKCLNELSEKKLARLSEEIGSLVTIYEELRTF